MNPINVVASRNRNGLFVVNWLRFDSVKGCYIHTFCEGIGLTLDDAIDELKRTLRNNLLYMSF